MSSLEKAAMRGRGHLLNTSIELKRRAWLGNAQSPGEIQLINVSLLNEPLSSLHGSEVRFFPGKGIPVRQGKGLEV